MAINTEKKMNLQKTKANKLMSTLCLSFKGTLHIKQKNVSEFRNGAHTRKKKKHGK